MEQKELDYVQELERLTGEIEMQRHEAQRDQEESLYEGVNLHVLLANKEETIRALTMRISDMEVS